MAAQPPPPPGGNVWQMLQRMASGLPGDRPGRNDISAGHPQEDSANLRVIADMGKKQWAELLNIRHRLSIIMSRSGGAGPGGFGGFGGGGRGGGFFGGNPWGLPNTRLGRLAHLATNFHQVTWGARALGSGNMTGGMASMARGIAGITGGAGKALGAAGAAAGAIAIPAAVIAAAVALGIALKNAADRLVEWNRELGKFSAEMARVYQQRDIREMFRERERGNLLAQSASQLTQEEQRFKDAIFPIQTAWQELKNNFLAGYYSSLADLAENVSEIAKMIGIEVKRRKDSPDHSFSGIVHQIADDADRKQREAREKALARRGR